MAIDPHFNQELADQAYTIYSNCEMQMMEAVRKRTERGITEPGWTERKQKEITVLRKDLEKIKKDTDKLHNTEISDGLMDSYRTGVGSAETDLGLPKTALKDIAVPRSVQRLVMEHNKAISGTSVQILRSAEDNFRRIQAEVSAAVLAGTETRQKAAQRMLNMMADEGLTGFVDKAGRKWEAASYAEMSTRTVTMRAAVQGHIDRQAETGNDLVIISAHPGACPTCVQFENEVLSIGGDLSYLPLEVAIEEGLFHPNCAHTLTGYHEDLMDPQRPKPKTHLEKIRAKEQYRYTQAQRYNERQIRRWKKRQTTAITPQEYQKSGAKISHYQKKQRVLLESFENEYGMTLARQYSRESIAKRVGIKGAETLKSWTKLKTKSPIVNKKAKLTQPAATSVDTKKYKLLKDQDTEVLADFKAKQAKHLNSAPKDQIQAIKKYSGSEYKTVNRYNRGQLEGLTTKQKNLARKYSDAISELIREAPPLDSDTIILRHNKHSLIKNILQEDIGVDASKKLQVLVEQAIEDTLSKTSTGAFEKLKKTVVGTRGQDKSFMSASYREGIFVQNEGSQLKLHLPKGYDNGVLIQSVSAHPSEAEYLINKAQRWEIFDVTVENVKVTIDGERRVLNTVFHAIPVND